MQGKKVRLCTLSHNRQAMSRSAVKAWYSTDVAFSNLGGSILNLGYHGTSMRIQSGDSSYKHNAKRVTKKHIWYKWVPVVLRCSIQYSVSSPEGRNMHRIGRPVELRRVWSHEGLRTSIRSTYKEDNEAADVRLEGIMQLKYRLFNGKFAIGSLGRSRRRACLWFCA